MTDKNKPVFGSDKPLTDPAQDRFSRDNFAKMVATSIVEMAPPEGLVIGLYGKWGTGKTTLLNFVRHYLEQYKKAQPIIIEFNPWWFSGESNLTWHFLNQFSATLAGRNQKFYKAASRGIRSIADLLAIAPITGSDIPQRLAGHLLDLDDASISNLKESVEKELSRSKRKILFIIDDIDRLTADEIRELFRTMKAIANFPHVVYLVAFDDDVVAKALEDVQGEGISGREYLEKIVQVSFPVPHTTRVMTLLEERVYELFGEDIDLLWKHDLRLFFGILNDADKKGLFEEVYGKLDLPNLIRTPRDVQRLINTLRVTYPMLKGDVHPADFLLTETLRIFRRDTYDFIRNNKSFFVSTTRSPEDMTRYAKAPDEMEDFRNLWIAGNEDIRKIVEFLFPRLKARPGFFTGELDRRDFQVADPERFDVYFSYVLEDTMISQSDLDTIISATSEPDRFESLIMQYENDPRFDDLLAGLVRRCTEIGKELIPEFAKTIVKIDERQNRREWGRILYYVLQDMGIPERCEILSNSIEKSEAVLRYADVISICAVGPAHKPEYGELLQHQAYTRLAGFVLDSIISLSKTRLATNSFNTAVLFLWKTLDSEQAVQNWLRGQFSVNNLSQLKDEEVYGLVDNVDSMDSLPSKYWSGLWPRLDDESLIALKERADNGTFSESQRVVIGAFLKERRQINPTTTPDESQD